MTPAPKGTGPGESTHEAGQGIIDDAVQHTTAAQHVEARLTIEESGTDLHAVVRRGEVELLRVPWTLPAERDAAHERIAELDLPGTELAALIEGAELADEAAAEPPAVSVTLRGAKNPTVRVLVGDHELRRDAFDPDSDRARAKFRGALAERHTWVWPSWLERVEAALRTAWDRERVAADLEAGRESGKRKRGEPQREDGRPCITIGTDLDVTVQECVGVLAASGAVYARGGSLVELVASSGVIGDGITRPAGSLTIRSVGKGRCAELLATCATFRVHRGGEVLAVQAPRSVAGDIVERGAWAGVPPLHGIVRAPTLRPDGTILRVPGYDEATGLFADFDPAPYADLPDRPTRDDARAALRTLAEPFTEFDLSGPSRAVLLSAILTGLARDAIDGPVPLVHVGSSTPGAGKSLACDVVSLIVSGTEPAKLILPHDPEETRKVVASLARTGDRVAMLDNLSGVVGDRVLAAAITAGRLVIRLFGRLDTETLPLSLLWLSSGNNVRWQADLARRVLQAEIAVECERPEERRFKRSDLAGWVREHRAELVQAGLVILAAHAAVGRPAHTLAPLGGFSGWDRTVRSALLWAGCEDPCSTRSATGAVADDDLERLAAILPLWRSRFGDVGETVSGAIARAGHPGRIGGDDDLRHVLALLDGRSDLNPRRIGQGLASIVGRLHDGMRLARTGARGGVVRWRVELVGTEPSREGWEGREGSVPSHAGGSPSLSCRGGETNPPTPPNPPSVHRNGHPVEPDEERQAIQADGAP